MKKLDYKTVFNVFEKENYTLISEEYINNYSKLKAICPKGHTFEISYNNFKRGRRCSECYKFKKLTHEQVKKFVESFGYKLLSEYKTANEKMTVSCPQHHQYDVTYGHFQSGERCPYCQNKKLYPEEVKLYVESIGYKLLSPYKTTRVYLDVECDMGHRYKVKFPVMQKGCRCPICNLSKGELKISNFLTSRKILFEQQKTFDDCILKNKLQFDFYIPSLELLIEYDGIQHYEPVDFAGKGDKWAEEYHRILKDRDCAKDDYCVEKQIRLLRIPYWEFDNIEQILDNELN